jgi:SSS family solute:Na+ symporter
MTYNVLQSWDWWVIGTYFMIIFGVSLYFYFQRIRKVTGETTEDYFLGSKNLTWMVIGSSLFASNIGSEHLIGLSGAGAKGDFAAAQFEIIASFMLLILGWFFVPFYMRSRVFTMPEFLEKRYSKWSRSYLTWVSIVAYVITKISVTIAAGGIVFTTLLGINFWTGAVLIVLFTGLYTVVGGLKVVVYTDTIQMFILIFGSIALAYYGVTHTYFGVQTSGGFTAVKQHIGTEHLSLWRSFTHPDFPWTGILFGAPILGVWYWCTDQFIVQRVLAAKNNDQAVKGTIFGAYLKLLPLFLFVIPGVIAYSLSIGDHPVIQFPEINGKMDYDAALPLMTMTLLPVGLKGLVVAGLLAALMSSLSSVFNSCATLFTMDVYRVKNPESSQKKLVRVGQLATALLVVLGLAWIPLMNLMDGGLFQKLQSIQAYISPPIAAVFLMGIYNRKITHVAAKWTLLFGASIGSLRLLLELIKTKLNGGILYQFASINFLHFAVLLFILSVFLLILLSRKEHMRPLEDIQHITYQKGSNNESASTENKILSLIVCICVVALWLIFI